MHAAAACLGSGRPGEKEPADAAQRRAGGCRGKVEGSTADEYANVDLSCARSTFPAALCRLSLGASALLLFRPAVLVPLSRSLRVSSGRLSPALSAKQCNPRVRFGINELSRGPGRRYRGKEESDWFLARRCCGPPRRAESTRGK